MLVPRILTAIALLAVLLPALFYPSPLPFAVVVLFLIAAGTWEWARMNQLDQRAAVSVAVVVALACAGLWHSGWVQQPGALFWMLVASAWVGAGAWLLQRGLERWRQLPQALRLLLGVAAMVCAWVATLQARGLGVNFLVSSMALVWVADVSAYFAGRRWGGRLVAVKLAPRISPGKTWEGFFGGIAGVLLCAALWLAADAHWVRDSPSLYTVLQHRGWGWMLLALLFMTTMGVVGDLVESLFKRSAGVKDSSNLLPGHGGVLDRLDALLPTLPIAMVFATQGLLP